MSNKLYARSLTTSHRPNGIFEKRSREAFDENSEEYNASEFGGIRDYERRKRIKLQNQDAIIRELAPAAPQIFSGMAIHINGYTKPSRSELWTLIVTYGGIYKQFLDNKTDVTHIIATNLTPTKQVEFARYRVVKPEWIMDSITASKPVSWQNYRVIDCGQGQGTIAFGNGGRLISANSRLDNSYKQVSSMQVESEEPSPETSSSVITPENIRPDECAVATNASTARADSSKLSVPLWPVVLDQQVAESFAGKKSIHDARDPGFLASYFASSRLHHLSSWKAELKVKMQMWANQSLSQRTRISKSKLKKDKCIIHVDFDCFFAAVSTRERPELIQKAVCVGHGGNRMGEVACCNYKAREYGIKNGMSMAAATDLCPELVTIPYDFGAYEEASQQFYKVLVALGADALEAVSVDEAILDVTGLLADVDSEAQIVAHASVLATQIRNNVRATTQCEVSVGMGANKLQARVALKRAKPGGQYYLTSCDVLGFMADLNVTDLPGIGWSTKKKLEEQFGVETVAQLREIKKYDLKRVFGPKVGDKLYDNSRGIDANGPAIGEIVARKSVSVEVNWGVRLFTQPEVERFMSNLCVELRTRLLDASYKGRHLLLKVMQRAQDAPVDPPKFLGHGKCDTQNRSAMLGQSTTDVEVLKTEAIAMLKSMSIPPKELRGIGLQMHKLDLLDSDVDAISNQQTLQHFFGREGDALQANEIDECLLLRPTVHTPISDRTDMTPFKVPLPILRLPTSSKAALPENLFESPTQYTVPSQIDPAVLAELPEALRAKLTRAIAVPSTRASESIVDYNFVPSPSQVDPEFLAAIPEDLRKEIVDLVQKTKADNSLNATHNSLRNSPRKPKPRPTTPKKPHTPKKTLQFIKKVSPKKPPIMKPLFTLTQANFVERTVPGKEGKIEPVIISSPPAEYDKEVLANLPESIRKEILAQGKMEKLFKRRREERAAEARAFLAGDAPRQTYGLPPKLELPSLNGVDDLDDLRDLLTAWHEAQKEDGPNQPDIESFVTYLGKIVQVERNLEKVEYLLTWLLRLASIDEEDLIWIQAARDIVGRTNLVCNDLGLGSLSIF